MTRLPTTRLREGKDDDLIEWLDSLDDEYGYKARVIKRTLRLGLDAALNNTDATSNANSETDTEHKDLKTPPAARMRLREGEEAEPEDAIEQETFDPKPERGITWASKLLRYQLPEMPQASVQALAESRNFRDVVLALDAVDRFFEERRDSWNEMILASLWLACRQILHRIAERRQQLAPQDRARMQELEAQDLPFMTPPDLAKELTDRAEVLYDRKLSFEERRQLIETIQTLFEDNDNNS